MIGQTVHHYQIVENLGQGRMGEVHLQRTLPARCCILP
jgi:hypothetical protein